MASGDELTWDLLPEAVRAASDPTIARRPAGNDAQSLTFDLVRRGLAEVGPAESDLYAKVVNRVERELISQVMLACDKVQIKAAARLGINRNTLHKKLKEYGLDSGSEE
jgi:DNA-binding protein Fis